jgi:hypothetical protein
MFRLKGLLHDAGMNTPLLTSLLRSRFSFLAATLCALSGVQVAVADASKAKSLDLDSAHVLAARAAGFGFSLREISFPARCIGEDKARGNVIALTVESDRASAWADVVCEHKLFENKTLQNGWTLAHVAVKRRCEVNEGGAWKPLTDSACELDVSAPQTGGNRLETRVRGSLKGSGALAQQARRLEVTYHFTLAGPAEMSPWSARR